MKKRIAVLLAFACWTLSILNPLTADVSAEGSGIPTLNKNGKMIESFVPRGWKLIQKTGGDLNKDGLADIAGVLELEKSRTEKAPPRLLFIAFRKGDQYRLSIQSSQAILLADEGGVFGDPFDSISVNRGSLLIVFYGGSNERWGYTYRFRFQDNGWYMIGATIDNINAVTGARTTEDYNLLTGDKIVTAIDEVGKKTEKKLNRGRKALVNLRNFKAGGVNQF